MQLNRKKSFFRGMLLAGIIMSFYGLLLKSHYATDSYAVYFNSDNGALQSARYTTFVFLKTLNFFNINVIKTQGIWTFLAILLLSYTIFTVAEQISETLGVETELQYCAVYAASLLLALNIAVLEWFLFPEVVFPYVLGLFCAIKAALMVSTSSKVSCFNWIGAFVLLLIGISTYQINLCFYLGAAILLCVLKTSIGLSKKTTVHIVNIFVCGGLAGLANVLLQKIVNHLCNIGNTDRNSVLSLHILHKNTIEILRHQYNIWIKGSELVGPSQFLFLIALIFLTMFSLEKLPNRSKLYLFCILMTTYIMSYIFAIVATFVWLSPRVLVGIYVFLFVFANICIYGLVTYRKHNKIWAVFIVAIGLFLVHTYSCGHGIIMDHFINNAVDQEYARQICYEIDKYEKENNLEVRTIAVGSDSQIAWKNAGVDRMAYNVNERAYLNDWSDVSLLNFVSNRLFIRKNMTDEQYKRYFQQTDWTQFDPSEQLYFEGDTLYWVKY